MKEIKSLLSIIAILLCSPIAYGQLIISPLQLPAGAVSVDNPLSIQVNNTLPEPQSGYIKITYSKAGIELAELTYQQVQLNPGVQNINTADLAKTAERITDKVTKQSRTITHGQIALCIEFISTINNASLASQCNTIILSENDTVLNQKNKFKFPATFTGYAEISGNYSNRQGSYQQLPANYTNVIINPKLEVLGIPIGARFNYSTASDRKQQNMNLFTLYFDADKFREKLDKKYITNIAQDYILEKTELTDYKQKTEEYKKISSILNNPYIKTELAKLSQLDSVNKLIQDSASYLSSSRLSELKSLQDTLSYLEIKREGYNSLLQKQKTLSTVLDIYNNPIETGLLKDSLDKLSKQLENTRNPFSADEERKLNELDSLLGDNAISKQRREVLKKQRDVLYEKKKTKQEYEGLKEKYAQLHHTYEYKSKLDSLRGKRGDASSILQKDSLKNILSNQKKIKDRFAFMKSVKSLNIGFFAPQTGSLTLNGVPVRGVGAEVQLKRIFVNIAAGKLQRSTSPNELNNSPSPYTRTLYSGVIGLGNSSGNFISLQYINAKDNENTFKVADSATDFFSTKTGFNQVLATKFRTVLFKGKTSIEGELAGSQLNNTNTIINEIGMKSYSADKWITNIINQSNGPDFRTGYAYNVSLKQYFNKRQTLLTLTSKKTMASFLSFGSPYLLPDILTNEARLTQQLWQGKLSITGFYRINSDNLDKLKTFTTKSQNFGGDVLLRVPKWPTLRVAYMPVMQQTPGNYFNTQMLMANSVYGLRKSIYYHQWSAMYISQTANSRIGYNNFNSKTYTLSYLLSVKQNLSFTLTGNYLEQHTTTALNGFTGNLSASYLFKKKLNQTAGIVRTDNNLDKRTTWFYELTYLFSQNLQLKIRYDNTNYLLTNPLASQADYKENLLIFRLITKW